MISFGCPYCKGTDIGKRGKRYNKSGDKQLYRCSKCRSTFVEPNGFERMRHKKEDIVRAMHMHNEGMSLFKTKDHLWQHDGIEVTRKTISDWTKKYSNFSKSTTSSSRAKA